MHFKGGQNWIFLRPVEKIVLDEKNLFNPTKLGPSKNGRESRLSSDRKDSVPFSKYFNTDQVFKTGSVLL